MSRGSSRQSPTTRRRRSNEKAIAAAAVLLAAVAVPALPASASPIPHSVLARDYCVNAGYITSYSTPGVSSGYDAVSCSTNDPGIPVTLESISAAFPALGYIPNCGTKTSCWKLLQLPPGSRILYPFVLVRDFCSGNGTHGHGRTFFQPPIAKNGEVDMDYGMCSSVVVK
jgi:hypothetical protein